jgi:hypothetical protein
MQQPDVHFETHFFSAPQVKSQFAPSQVAVPPVGGVHASQSAPQCAGELLSTQLPTQLCCVEGHICPLLPAVAAVPPLPAPPWPAAAPPVPIPALPPIPFAPPPPVPPLEPPAPPMPPLAAGASEPRGTSTDASA